MASAIKDNRNKVVERNNSQNVKKRLQKRQLIRLFYREGSKTIADLCDATNNSIPSITNTMHEMAAEGWVRKFGVGHSKGGRRPAIYGISPDAGMIAAIDLSRKDSRLGVFNLQNHRMCDELEIQEGLNTTDEILQILRLALDELLDKHGLDKKKVLGLGITIPGLIDLKTGVSYSFPLFGDRPLVDLFEELFGLPVVIEHDTKAMALGEAWFGLAREISNVLFINIGSGIGLGIMIDGKLYHGHSGFSGEFGHIQMNPDGHLCYCGKIGCLETIASGTALVKKAGEMIGQGKNTIISTLVDQDTANIKLATIIEAAYKGDHFAIELIEEAGEHLAKGISMLIHLFNPEAIIIGGEMAEAGNLITDPVQQKLNKYTMLRLKQETHILLSDLKKLAGLYGLLPIVADRVFDTHFIKDQPLK